MSVPRLRRTVALTPRPTSWSRKRRTPAGDGAPHRIAGGGVEGDQVDVGAEGPGQLGQLARRRWARSLTPAISAHSKLSRRPLALRYCRQASTQQAERIAAVERDQACRGAGRWRRAATRPG